MLEDVLEPGLKLVVCGTAAGKRSAQVGAYYAGPGNKFWRTLAAVGLTPRQLAPAEYALLPTFGIGLTDVVKGQSGPDQNLRFSSAGPATLRSKIEQIPPRVLCFNGKRAASEYLRRDSLTYGWQHERIGSTRLFVAPSTSGAASGYWDIELWREMAAFVRVEAVV